MKAKQIGFQLLRRLYKPRYADLTHEITTTVSELEWSPFRNQDGTVVDEAGLSFNYLHKKKVFRNGVDWNYSDNGKLWTYNLNYFEFLNNPDLNDDTKISIMRDYYLKRHTIEDGMEPYPLSLRNMNWIKFCSSSGVREFDNFIYAQASLLSKSFEYHLMGNHLLENAFSLLFAAYYFKGLEFYDLASKVLEAELQEQILPDGGHFERSPMYHQIILYRLLDIIHFIRDSEWKYDLLEDCERLAARMLSWIQQVSFTHGGIPMVNDSSVGIAPSTADLFKYAAQLGILPSTTPLGRSGYRMEKWGAYECFLDFGDIGPDYIPGHAHSDTFSFELYHNGEPLIVDTGISTYENNAIRHFERSTSAHNTVKVLNLDQSEVWGAFRVARRARVVDLEERDGYYRSSHDGYLSRLGVTHQREFEFGTNQITIKDTIIGKMSHMAKAYFHFPPQAEPVLSENACTIGSIKIIIKNGIAQLSSYDKAVRFNERSRAKFLEIQFYQNLEVRIVI